MKDGIIQDVFNAVYEGLNQNKTLTIRERMRQKQFTSLIEKQLIVQIKKVLLKEGFHIHEGGIIELLLGVESVEK